MPRDTARVVTAGSPPSKRRPPLPAHADATRPQKATRASDTLTTRPPSPNSRCMASSAGSTGTYPRPVARRRKRSAAPICSGKGGTGSLARAGRERVKSSVVGTVHGPPRSGNTQNRPLEPVSAKPHHDGETESWTMSDLHSTVSTRKRTGRTSTRPFRKDSPNFDGPVS